MYGLSNSEVPWMIQSTSEVSSDEGRVGTEGHSIQNENSIFIKISTLDKIRTIRSTYLSIHSTADISSTMMVFDFAYKPLKGKLEGKREYFG